MSIFKDRKHAGKLLAEKLTKYKDKDAVVLGIPRGGVIVAKEIADALNLPLNIVVVKKIGSPFNKEYAIGAVDMDGNVYLGEHARMEASEDYIKEEAKRKMEEIRQRVIKYGGKELPDVKGKICIVVDDGIATGLTAKAAAGYLRRHHASRLVLAVPVAPPDSLKELEKEFDEVVCLLAPQDFMAVSQFYLSFPQLDDEDVIEMLRD